MSDTVGQYEYLLLFFLVNDTILNYFKNVEKNE